jgi:hypothetical protein
MAVIIRPTTEVLRIGWMMMYSTCNLLTRLHNIRLVTSRLCAPRHNTYPEGVPEDPVALWWRNGSGSLQKMWGTRTQNSATLRGIWGQCWQCL